MQRYHLVILIACLSELYVIVEIEVCRWFNSVTVIILCWTWDGWWWDKEPLIFTVFNITFLLQGWTRHVLQTNCGEEKKSWWKTTDSVDSTRFMKSLIEIVIENVNRKGFDNHKAKSFYMFMDDILVVWKVTKIWLTFNMKYQEKYVLSLICTTYN